MSSNDNEIRKEDLPQAFADFFRIKVETIQSEIRVEPGVYNWARKVSDVLNEVFMLELNVKECIESIKVKNCEGYVI